MNVPQVPSLPLSRAALRLALAHMGTFWDALYVALAVENDLEVVAADEPMTKAFAPLERTIHLANLEL
jgi:predicted nucleic acid-binding protein